MFQQNANVADLSEKGESTVTKSTNFDTVLTWENPVKELMPMIRQASNYTGVKFMSLSIQPAAIPALKKEYRKLVMSFGPTATTTDAFHITQAESGLEQFINKFK